MSVQYPIGTLVLDKERPAPGMHDLPLRQYLDT